MHSSIISDNVNSYRLGLLHIKYSNLQREITVCADQERRSVKTSKLNFVRRLKLGRLVREMDSELTEILSLTLVNKKSTQREYSLKERIDGK